jgi:lactate dehydrogenase-like 2-hydroxyacid dehydrogenase
LSLIGCEILSKQKVVTFLPPPLDFQRTHIFSNRLDSPDVELVHVPVDASEEEACQKVSNATVLLSPPIRHFNRRLIEAAKGAKLIQTISVGYDFVDLEAANEFKIPVANNPGWSSTSVAEHTMMFMLILLKKGLRLHDMGNKEQWTISEKQGFWNQVRELKGKTLGILGFGDIGKEVARLARVFGPEILYCKRNRLSDKMEEELSVEYCSLDELLARSDIFSIHVPLTEETRGMIGREEVAKMKPGAILLNLSRGEIIDDEALAEALRDGRLSGVGTDVLTEIRRGNVVETPSPLIGMENVMITPHMAGPTPEARARSEKQATDNILRVIRGEKPLNLVNDVWSKKL